LKVGDKKSGKERRTDALRVERSIAERKEEGE